MISTEFEKKYSITLATRVKLEKSLPIPDSSKRQVDRYYDSKNAALFIRGIFVRIRGDRFQIKYNLHDVMSHQSSGHTECSEIDLPLSLSQQQAAQLADAMGTLSVCCPDNMTSPFHLFDFNNWFESVVIDKKRTLYRFDALSIYLDDVADLGIFLEIESMVKDPLLSPKEQKIIDIIENSDTDYIDTGYNALFWRNKDPSVYRQSPYVMNRDADVY